MSKEAEDFLQERNPDCIQDIGEIMESYAQHKCVELMAELGKEEHKHTLELNKIRKLHDEQISKKDQRIADLKAEVKLLKECRDYDASGQNRPEGYILADYHTRNRINQITQENNGDK